MQGDKYQEADVLQRQLQKERSLDYFASGKLPEVQALIQEARRIGHEGSLLSAQLIRINMRNFGLADMQVAGIIKCRDGRRTITIPSLPLSELCARVSDLRYLATRQAGIGYGEAELGVQVEYEGQIIGCVAPDGWFEFTAASSVREMLGHFFATCGGQRTIINQVPDPKHSSLAGWVHPLPLVDFDLDIAAAEMTEEIVTHQNFFGFLAGTCKKWCISGVTTRTSNGPNNIGPAVWTLATRLEFGAALHAPSIGS